MRNVMLALLILGAMLLVPQASVVKASTPLNELVVNTIAGGGPTTLDPANCYDTASAELLFNVYEPLIFFDGERYDYFIPKLATQVWVAPPDPAAPAYTNFTVYFKIREGVKFHTWCRSDLGNITWEEYPLTTEDVEYTFERWMVKDYIGGPQWMIYEPLLSCRGADREWPSDESNPINQAVQRNSTHVWLNIANKGRAPRTSTPTWTPVPLFEENPASPWYGKQRPQFWGDVASLSLGYPLRIFFQVISQPWACIISKQWIINYVIPNGPDMNPNVPGVQVDWDGNWGGWVDYCRWEYSPIDKIPQGAAHPGVACGTGPYILDRYDPTTEWSVVWNPDYWGGWPAKTPSPPYPDSPTPPTGIRPKGYVERMTVIQTDTNTRITNLINGECDFAAIPRARASSLHVDNNRNGPTLPGIRLNYPIPEMTIFVLHMNLDIEPTPDNRYGKIYDNDELHEDGIPRNFFNNTNVRKAFSHLINYTMILDFFNGEAYQPNTFAPSGLPYVNLAIPKHSYNEDKAAYYFDQAYFGDKKLTDYGFTVYITYYYANVIGWAIAEQLATAINTLAARKGWPFHAYVAVVSYLYSETRYLTIFFTCWLMDYADIHNSAYAYCHSNGVFARLQRYHNPHMDELIEKGVHTPDGPARQAIYDEVQEIFYDEAVAVPSAVPVGRVYMRDWVQGYYYNPIYPGVYAYTLWKWPMTDTVGAEGYFVGDVNFDGKVSMDDVVAIVDAFGSYAGKRGMPIMHPKWNFYCDVDGNPFNTWRDRKIDMYDISAALDNFGKRSIPWHP